MLKFTTTGWQVFTTRMGPVGLCWGRQGVSRLELGLSADELATEMSRLSGQDQPVRRSEPAVTETTRRVKALLRGKNDGLLDVPVDLSAQTAFARQVLRRLRKVPPGKVITYGALAAACGRPTAARAIGRIMGANPVPVIVPCHRCVGADGALTGFSTPGGIGLKAKMLFVEGYEFDPAHAAGIRHLQRQDPVMKRLIRIVGPYRALPDRRQPPWDTLITAIVHQQLSLKAGQTIAGRVRDLTPGDKFPTADEVLALAPETIRGCGLSHMKVGFVRDLAARVIDGRLKLGQLARLDDAAVSRELTAVRGIGPWSAHMHLIFHLGRLDVLPTGDLGLQMAAAKAYGLAEYATPAQMTALGEKWRPYRSMASWYLWQGLSQGGLA